MRRVKLATALLLMCCLAGSAVAQEIKAESVIKQIPSGSMGYVVMNSIKASTESADKFLLDIGVSQFIKAAAPQGLLGAIQKEFNLGEGFDASGGFAAVMLEPSQFNIDLADVVQRKTKGEKVQDVKLPVVVFVPGKDMSKTFPNLTTQKQGDFTVVELPFGPVFAIEHNGYILFSPNDKALTAVKEAKTKADSELTKERREMITRNDIALQVNVKICYPTFSKLMDVMEKQVATAPAAEQDMKEFLNFNTTAMKMNKEMLAQVDSFTAGGRIAKTGVLFETLTDYIPTSEMGQAMAGMKISTKPLLGRVPNLTYAFALGAAGVAAPSQQLQKTQAEAISQLMQALAKASDGKITKEQLDSINKLCQDFLGQCTGFQMVIGGAPEGSGLFGVAGLMECADAAKAKGMLAELTTQIQGVVNAAVTEESDRPTLTYTKNGEGTWDVIEISHPEMAAMPEEQRTMMKTVLGEDKVRILISSPDDKTVVFTFGGSKAMMEEAVKAATSGGSLPQDKGLTAAMENMPKNLVMVGAINGANIFELVVKATSTFGGFPIPFRLTSQVPLTFGSGITGSSQHGVFYVPTELVKEVSGIILMQRMMQGGGMGGMPGGMPATAPNEEF